MSFILCGHGHPYDLCHHCEALQQVREQYGSHRLVPAPDGGCTRCPLSSMDKIHFVAPPPGGHPVPEESA